MKIGTKILAIILSISMLALFGVAILSYSEMLNLNKYSSDANTQLGSISADESEKALKNLSEEYIVKIANEQALKSNEILARVANEVTAMAQYVTTIYENKSNFRGKMLPLPDQTEMGVPSSKYMTPPSVVMTTELENEIKLLSNAEYMLAPTLKNNSVMSNIYLGTNTGISYRYSLSNLYKKEYDPRERAWFLQGMENKGSTIWLDTYVDSYGIICATVASAFKNESGEYHGVLASDITLSQLQDDITSMKIGETGYAFLIDNLGNIISHPDYGKANFSTTPLTDEMNDMGQGIRFMLENETEKRLCEFTLNGKDVYLAYQTLPSTNWILGIIVEVDEIIQPAVETKLQIDIYTKEAQEHIDSTLTSVLVNYVIILAVSTMLILILSYIVSGTITKPIKVLVKEISRIGEGDLDSKVTIKGKDEIAELGTAFNNMTTDLKTYIENLSDITKEKERIEAELDVAKDIQSSMLPHIFPPFTQNDNFDIYATMLPAKEVGGDFYDFFVIDEDHLAIVIADVSGKGVPAALFMVITKALVKNHAVLGLSPKEIFEGVNAQLCEGNEAQMFVTAFLGILNTKTGEIKYVNAGHNAPCIKRKDGEFTFFKGEGRPNFVLAGMENIKYREYSAVLKKGDVLYLYTDGITEATRSDGKLFGDSRLIDALNKHKDEKITDLLPNIKLEIDEFIQDAPQFDDMTMLALHIHEEDEPVGT